MPKNNIRFVFYFPSSRIGGAQLLFARLAEALISSEIQVLILKDNEEDFIHNYLTEKNLQFKSFQTSKSNKYKLKEDDFLILSLSFIRFFDQYLQPHKNTGLIFWDLHPYALIETTALSKIYKKFNSSWILKFSKFVEFSFFRKVKTFVTVANDHHAIYFMCFRNYKTNQDLFNFQIKPNYLPIPITLNNKPGADFKGVNTINNNTRLLRIGWISRMDVDKVAVLKLLIKDISQFNNNSTNYKVQLHAIGKGNAFNELEEDEIAMSDMLKLPGILYGEDLDSYIKNNIDIGFSMGTSALEFAKRKVATILVPSVTRSNFFSNEKRRYVWLHDSFGFDVAVERIYSNNINKDFEGIITEYRNEKELLTSKSHEYVIEHHSFNEIFKKFLKLTSHSTLTYSNFCKVGFSNIGGIESLLFSLKEKYKKYCK